MINLIALLISNSDIFDKMYQEINRQNTFYFWIIGIVLTISIAIAGFFGILQWRLSDKQIKTLKIQIEKDLVAKYKLLDIEQELDQTIINNAIRYENSINSEILKLEDGLNFEGYSFRMEYSERKIVIDMTSIINSAIDDEIKTEIYNRSYSRIERLSNMVKNQKDNDKWTYLFSQLLNNLLTLKEK